MRGFTKLKKKHLLKISAVYLIGNPEICQDPPSCDQDDQTLLYIQKLDIEKTEPVLKIDTIYIAGLVFPISNFFINKISQANKLSVV